MKHPTFLHAPMRWGALSVALWMMAGTPSRAAQPAPFHQQVSEFLTSVRPVLARGAAPAPPAEAARSARTPEGFLRYVGAPAFHHFPAEGAAPGQPEVTAHRFLAKHGPLFGATSPAVDFAHLKTRDRNNRRYVRFQQTYAGVPVFAAQVTLQLDTEDGIESVLSHIERNTASLDEKRVSTVPALTVAQAEARARTLFTAKTVHGQLAVQSAQLSLFAPSVLGEDGPVRLTWEMIVLDKDEAGLNERIFLDAQTGELVRQIPLHCEALGRQIFDGNNTTADPGTLVRVEGGAASWLADANNVYDFFGDIYNFYWNYHRRDGVDGAGMRMSATVRSALAANAFWDPNQRRMYYSSGWVTDDVSAHEVTHGVTQFESDLVYMNASGAINESFSDIWGEFVDLTNGRGDDSPAVRWRIGEEVAGRPGGIRSMSDPTLFNHPDRLGSSYYYNGTWDNGGVHENSGVNNKLCYLLTDGDTFNGQTVRGLGIGRVAGLYYEVNANLLTSGADWADLYHALTQAAINLGWSDSDRSNLYRACVAVQIATSGGDWYVDWSSGCLAPAGNRDCFLGFFGPFATVGEGIWAAAPGDSLYIRTGSYNESLTFTKTTEVRAYDGPVILGR
jgi:Zn-dependent metalloprotease